LAGQKLPLPPPIGNVVQRSSESMREFLAAAESPARTAPLTPAAPGNLEAPMVLSRVR
jgi:hypothetical protein